MKSYGSFSIRKVVLATLLVVTLSQLASASLLRGRLVYPNGAPAGGFAVTVYSQAMGRSAPVYTDATGMYYLNVPAGPYYLEVWVSRDPRVQPRVYPIQIGEPYTDFPPIVVG
jgi:hypothetical protein